MSKRKTEIDMGLLGALRGQGLTMKQIADRMGITVGSVEWWLRKNNLVVPRVHEDKPDMIEAWRKAMP